WSASDIVDPLRQPIEQRHHFAERLNQRRLFSPFVSQYLGEVRRHRSLGPLEFSALVLLLGDTSGVAFGTGRDQLLIWRAEGTHRFSRMASASLCDRFAAGISFWHRLGVGRCMRARYPTCQLADAVMGDIN